MDLDPVSAWNALAARDARFDGRFFVGVTSTGIYCRPVCRVRTPRRENCRFFSHAAQAAQAGFRPCLRCRPELAPGLSLIDSPQALAREAAHMLDHAAQCGGALTMPALAARLGVTDRHLRRVFAGALGVAPLDYLVNRRLLLAKQMLTDTRLPVSEVAAACGFGSVRRFQTLFAERLRLTPSQLRRQARPATAEDASLQVRLSWRPPYDVDSMLDFWRQRALPGVEVVDGQGLRRTLRLDDAGTATWLSARFDPDPARPALRVTAGPSSGPHWGRIVAAARDAFDLDADPEGFGPVVDDIAARSDGHRIRPGLRVPGSFDGFETALRIILGQQVTVAAARTLAARVTLRFGTPVTTPFDGLDRLFPDAATIAAAPASALGELGIVRQRVGAIQSLARAVCEGLPLHRGAPLQTTREALLALPGIGPWTVELLCLRTLGWPDAFPDTDIGVLRALGLKGAGDAPQARAEAERWRPWRAYATLALWRTLDGPAGPADAPDPASADAAAHTPSPTAPHSAPHSAPHFPGHRIRP